MAKDDEFLDVYSSLGNPYLSHALERKTFGKYRSGAIAVCGAQSQQATFARRKKPTCQECLRVLRERKDG